MRSIALACKVDAENVSAYPAFKPQESRLYNTVWRLFGFSAAERTASFKRKWRVILAHGAAVYYVGVVDDWPPRLSIGQIAVLS